ncbi:NAD(P)-dependent oxidoreductase [Pseudomonas sp. ML96]|uniref:NAD-dependent epimerase/dehydratase family protein n=1 Tax=Pseudomonas sp. ML96 TaxID=1523503 RepID=UPI0009DD5E3F|nr:NAD-dependent epimerase/dehydratase family protein [Pseudomonas sp. ML96]
MTIACVTGGNGLVGRHIVSLLLEAGYQVRILSRSVPAGAVAGVEYFQGALADTTSLRAFLDSAALIFHCAAELKSESLMWAVNVEGTQNLADAFKVSGAKFFYFISSAGVVGLTRNKVVTEDEQCVPRNLYESSKLAAERVLLQSIPLSSLVILRPTNVIDNERPGVLQQALRSDIYSRLKFFLKGKESAHLVHANDVARAALSFIGKDESHYGRCYFISCDRDPDNYMLGVRRLVHYYAFGRNNLLMISLPVFFPFLMRWLVSEKSNRGDVIYSSDRLSSTGFSYAYTVQGMVKEFAEFYMKPDFR